MAEQAKPPTDESVDSPRSRISVLEIARRLSIGRLAVYAMLQLEGSFPAFAWAGAVDHHPAGISDLGEHLRLPGGRWT